MKYLILDTKIQQIKIGRFTSVMLKMSCLWNYETNFSRMNVNKQSYRLLDLLNSKISIIVFLTVSFRL